MTRVDRLGWVAGDADGQSWSEGTGRHFLELSSDTALTELSLCAFDAETNATTRTVATMTIPDGKLPVFFRRSKIALDAPTQECERVTCIGYRDKVTGEGTYTFVRPDGEVIVTQDAWGVLPD